MSIMDKIKSLFSSGGASADTHDHSGQDHSGHDHAGHDHATEPAGHEPVAPPMPPADPAGMPTSDPAPGDGGEDRPS